LSQAGIAPVPASAVKGTGNKIEKLDAGTYRDTETGSMFMVDEKGNHIPLNDPQSGKIQRGPQFGDLGMGTFQLPDNLDPAAAQLISVIQNSWTAKGLDPNVGLAMAMTESSLNPSAKAKGSSATGLFQFTKDTAKDFGLADRKDAEASANAAADLFKVLLDRTNGDVIKAIALYHGGRNKGEPDQEDLNYVDKVRGYLQTTSADSNVTDLKASFF
jgi:soluble lytic murein transglycosylase-like protein